MGRLCQASRIQEKSCGKKPHIFYILIQARLEIILDRACTLGDVLLNWIHFLKCEDVGDLS